MDAQIKILQQKLNDSTENYTDAEVEWLFNHIGDPISSIRDNLVCNSFGSGLLENRFSIKQVCFLVNQLENENPLFYQINKQGQYTLIRSFSCLLWDLIIQVNNNQKSKYFKLLSSNEEKRILIDLIKYLSSETDFTGFSDKYGWVHAVAHCSDALADGINSKGFDIEFTPELLSSVFKMLHNVNKRFIDGEEYRLADVFVELFRNKKISAILFINWINEFDFDPYSSNLIEFYQFNNLKSLLENIYIKLDTLSLLNSDLKQFIQENFSKEY